MRYKPNSTRKGLNVKQFFDAFSKTAVYVFLWFVVVTLLLMLAIVAAHSHIPYKYDDRIPGDINGDGLVNFHDFLLLAENYGKQYGFDRNIPQPITSDITEAVLTRIYEDLGVWHLAFRFLDYPNRQYLKWEYAFIFSRFELKDNGDFVLEGRRVVKPGDSASATLTGNARSDTLHFETRGIGWQHPYATPGALASYAITAKVYRIYGGYWDTYAVDIEAWPYDLNGKEYRNYPRTKLEGAKCGYGLPGSFIADVKGYGLGRGAAQSVYDYMERKLSGQIGNPVAIPLGQ